MDKNLSNETYATISFPDENNYRLEFYTDEDKFFRKFYSLSEAIGKERNISKRLSLCEKSYLLLPDFIKLCIRQDDEISPVINCRDIGPTLYIQTGQWDKARAAFQKCVSANAYYGEDIIDVIQGFNDFLSVSQRITQYIKNHPGILQKNLYKEMEFNPDEKDNAIYFVRTSKILIKEPYKNTNKLFVSDYN